MPLRIMYYYFDSGYESFLLDPHKNNAFPPKNVLQTRSCPNKKPCRQHEQHASIQTNKNAFQKNFPKKFLRFMATPWHHVTPSQSLAMPCQALCYVACAGTMLVRLDTNTTQCCRRNLSILCAYTASPISSSYSLRQ